MTNLFKKNVQQQPKDANMFALASYLTILILILIFVLLALYYGLSWDCNLGYGWVPFDPETKLECTSCDLTIDDTFRLGLFEIDTTLGFQDTFESLKAIDTTDCNAWVLAALGLRLKTATDTEADWTIVTIADVDYVYVKNDETAPPGLGNDAYSELFSGQQSMSEHGSEDYCEEASIYDDAGSVASSTIKCGCELDGYIAFDPETYWQTQYDQFFGDCNQSAYYWYSYDVSGYANMDAFYEEQPTWHNTYMYYDYHGNMWDKASFWCYADSNYLAYDFDGVATLKTDCNYSSVVENFASDIYTTMDNDFTNLAPTIAEKICDGYLVGEPELTDYTVPVKGNCYCDQCVKKSAVEVLTLATAGVSPLYSGLVAAIGFLLASKIGYQEDITDNDTTEMATTTIGKITDT